MDYKQFLSLKEELKTTNKKAYDGIEPLTEKFARITHYFIFKSGSAGPLNKTKNKEELFEKLFTIVKERQEQLIDETIAEQPESIIEMKKIFKNKMEDEDIKDYLLYDTTDYLIKKNCK